MYDHLVRVYVNREVVNAPWGGGNSWVRAFRTHSKDFGLEIVDDPYRADVIVVVGLDAQSHREKSFCDLLRVRSSTHSKIVVRVNDCDARKGTTGVDDTLLSAMELSDDVIFVSHWLKDYFLSFPFIAKCSENLLKKIHYSNVVKNGIDKERFFPREKSPRTTIDIVTAHWSDNEMKGKDVVEWLDEFVSTNDKFTYTYIGRTKARLRNSHHVKPIENTRLGEELSKYDLCVNGTLYDPGPNAVIESISCGLPTYVRDRGGGAVEFAGVDHTFSNLEDLREILTRGKYKKNTTEFDDWRTSISKVVSFLERNTCEEEH